MTREEFINRFMEILKSKLNLSETAIAEISLLLELMPNTTNQPMIYYYPYYQSLWKSSPYEDNKIYCTSDANDIKTTPDVDLSERLRQKPSVESPLNGRKFDEKDLIKELMEDLIS